MKRTELVVFFCIMVVAVVLRLYGLSSIPPGLSSDEALNGKSAVHAQLNDEYKIFYPENGGREGLYINLQSLSVRVLGDTPFALRLVSALAGVLTVLGVYLLTRRLFDDWRVAAIASFLMAVGFWHLHFSRIGIQEILEPLFAIWGFYYLYKGMETNRLWHWALSGVWFGLGFHTAFSYRIVPIVIACTLFALWLSLSAAFSHAKYRHARHQMLGGIAMMTGIMIIVILPITGYFYTGTPVYAPVSLNDVAVNAVSTIGMFFVDGDSDWMHGIPGEPVLFWPVAAFFAVGLLHTLWRFAHSWRTRGHPGVVQTLLLSWFIIGLVPSLFSSEGMPNALRTLWVSPAVYILAAAGIHWLSVAMMRWYGSDEGATVFGKSRGPVVVTAAVLSILIAVWVSDSHRYFVRWAHNPVVTEIFSQRVSR